MTSSSEAQDISPFLIIGGTGTLGRAIMDKLYSIDSKSKIVVLSRDEQKQQELKKIYPQTTFVLGDVRDKDTLDYAMKGAKTVFHVAALKHIDHIEDNPIESIKTNIIGTINVAECCIKNDVKHCVFSSTDKAVDPINVYGHCKAISEKLFFNYNQHGKTNFTVYRWGNINGSNGSAIPYFVKLLKEKKPIPVTDTRMTRFWINIEDAVDFIFETFQKKNNAVQIPWKMKTATVLEVIQSLSEIYGTGPYKIAQVGLRKGEKLHEAMQSQHSEGPITSENFPRYSKSELAEFLKRGLEKCHI